MKKKQLLKLFEPNFVFLAVNLFDIYVQSFERRQTVFVKNSNNVFVENVTHKYEFDLSTPPVPSPRKKVRPLDLINESVVAQVHLAQVLSLCARHKGWSVFASWLKGPLALPGCSARERVLVAAQHHLGCLREASGTVTRQICR